MTPLAAEKCTHGREIANLVDRFERWAQIDCPYCQIAQLRLDLAQQIANAKTVLDLQEQNETLQNLLGNWLHWFGSSNDISVRTRRALDVPCRHPIDATMTTSTRGVWKCRACGALLHDDPSVTRTTEPT